MIRIGICEDELFFSSKLLELIKEYFVRSGEEYAVDAFPKGEALLAAGYDTYDILCLDVEIKEGMDGITLAKEIRKNGGRSQIIFITSHQEEAYKAFEVEAFRYLLKPLQKEMFFSALDAVLQRIKKIEKQKIVLKFGQQFVQLQLSEVLYIETVGRKVRVCALKSEYFADNTLRELEAALSDQDFFRVHKSYLVHFAFVKEHDNQAITMQNGDQVFISRLRLNRFKNKFIAYLRRMCNGGDC